MSNIKIQPKKHKNKKQKEVGTIVYNIQHKMYTVEFQSYRLVASCSPINI